MPPRMRPAAILRDERTLGEIVRPILDQAIGLAREELKTKGFLEKIPPEPEFDEDEDDDEDWDEVDDLEDEDDVLEGTLAGWEDDPTVQLPDDVDSSEEDFDDGQEDEDESEEDDVFEPLTAEALGHVVRALSTIADPLGAVDTIMTAFDEGLVDEYVVTRNHVVEDYEDEAPREADTSCDWLSIYREDYAEHLESLRTPPPPAPAGQQHRGRSIGIKIATMKGSPQRMFPPPSRFAIRGRGSAATTLAGAAAARSTRSATSAKTRRISRCGPALQSATRVG